MVRFIIKVPESYFKPAKRIYIPIWLDLLLVFGPLMCHRTQNLHSNMVRFIIDLSQEHVFTAEAFTFQYG